MHLNECVKLRPICCLCTWHPPLTQWITHSNAKAWPGANPTALLETAVQPGMCSCPISFNCELHHGSALYRCLGSLQLLGDDLPLTAAVEGCSSEASAIQQAALSILHQYQSRVLRLFHAGEALKRLLRGVEHISWENAWNSSKMYKLVAREALTSSSCLQDCMMQALIHWLQCAWPAVLAILPDLSLSRIWSQSQCCRCFRSWRGHSTRHWDSGAKRGRQPHSFCHSQVQVQARN